MLLPPGGRVTAPSAHRLRRSSLRLLPWLSRCEVIRRAATRPFKIFFFPRRLSGAPATFPTFGKSGFHIPQRVLWIAGYLMWLRACGRGRKSTSIKNKGWGSGTAELRSTTNTVGQSIAEGLRGVGQQPRGGLEGLWCRRAIYIDQFLKKWGVANWITHYFCLWM